MIKARADDCCAISKRLARPRNVTTSASCRVRIGRTSSHTDDVRRLRRHRSCVTATGADSVGNDAHRRFASLRLARCPDAGAALDGVASHWRSFIDAVDIECCNNTTKVVQRMAFGYRDDPHFVLSVCAELVVSAGLPSELDRCRQAGRVASGLNGPYPQQSHCDPSMGSSVNQIASSRRSYR